MTSSPRFESLIGAWTGDEELFPTAWTAAGTAQASIDVRPGPDGIHFDYVETRDGSRLDAHAVVAGGGFWWFDSYGFTPQTPGTAAWDGDTLVLDRRSDRGRTVMRLRAAGDSLEVELDTAVPADADLAPLVRGTYRRAD
ncbi:hypothetical protein JNB62_13985 [Microbacterium jejuense]|uniref:DUF1579 domain-containing protein n=1 Tax=Microbacterium jejuense TaxID=1263637 RepID=A0ABS7HQS6_9MICO|nr:hypothetical protein [Microbacterium jejuense]MBW9094799.1 hypothetical protein [Microbacterium jejuense]